MLWFDFLAQMLTFIMLARLSALSPNAVLQRLERLIEPLRATCSTKVRPGCAAAVGSATKPPALPLPRHCSEPPAPAWPCLCWCVPLFAPLSAQNGALGLQVKAGSVKQEFEKQDELKRSAMRAVAALLTIPEVEKSRVMAEFSSQIRANPEMASLFESIQKDSASLPTSESMDMS